MKHKIKCDKEIGKIIGLEMWKKNDWYKVT